MKNRFLEHSGVELPVIAGPMYPCSNPELLAAVSEAGGLGVIQPITLTHVCGYEFEEGLKYLRTLTQKPLGLNILVEKSMKKYHEKMKGFVECALKYDVKFFITALGNPKWVIDRVKPHGGVVYHDVTEIKFAQKVIPYGVDGFICVNNQAGGHLGKKSPQDLYTELSSIRLPLVAAGGVGNEAQYRQLRAMGYEGVQMGTRFIATQECSAHEDYKQAILKASASDIVVTEKVTGVPLSVINTPYIQKIGTKADFFAKKLLQGRKTKHLMRFLYFTLASIQLKKSLQRGNAYREYYQAGRSVEGIQKVESVADLINQIRLTESRL